MGQLEIVIERCSDVAVFTVRGRLDAFGAKQLDERAPAALKPGDRFAILEFSGVSYLSSGGIRSLITLAKLLQTRKGELLLVGVTGYCGKVLEMAGFDRMFPRFDALEEAVRHAASPESAGLEITFENANLLVHELSDHPARLLLVGDIQKVLYATLAEKDIAQRRFLDTEYSIGLGALGDGLAECMPLFGEMITIGGTMVWLPTDTHDTPDFLIPAKDTGAIRIFTGFNAALQGPFNDLVHFKSEDENGCSLQDIFSALFAFARQERPHCRGLISVAMLSEIRELYSSGVKISPVEKNRPANREMIMAKENMAEWVDINQVARYAGETMVSFGIGINLQGDLSGYDQALLNQLYYVHPANRGSTARALHNHGVIFKRLPYHPEPELDAAIRRTVQEGEFLDMRHLLDNTRLRRATLGVSYISELKIDPSVVS